MELKELEKYGVDIKEINMLIKKAKEDTTYLVVTGEFSAGKSCFINCLLNKEDFLPYGNTECTPILLDMYQGEESSLVVQHIDGSVDPIEYSTDNIERYARYGADDFELLPESYRTWKSKWTILATVVGFATGVLLLLSHHG